MKIKNIKQFLCIHDYKLISSIHAPGCLLKEYYECTKCGKIMCERYLDGNDN